MENAIYRATLVDRAALQTDRDFLRLTDAIRWVSGELNADHGNIVFGEIRCQDLLLWKRGERPATTSTTRTA